MAKAKLEPGLMSVEELWRAVHRRMRAIEPGTDAYGFATKCLLWRESVEILAELQRRGIQMMLDLDQTVKR